MTLANRFADREEAKREDNFDFANEYEDDEEDEEWEQEADWNNEADEEEIKDESAAYLEFLNEEAQKFGGVDDDDDDDEELEEESLLETPLDKVEPYSMFKHALLRKLRCPLAFEHNLTDNRAPTRTACAVRKPYKKPQP